MAAVRQAVALRADVIMAQTDEPTYLLPVTRDIPLVLWGVDSGRQDSIEMLNRRGENVTGALYSYIHLVLKRFELLKELRPGARRAAQVVPESLSPPTEQSERSKRRTMEAFAEGARKLGLEFTQVVLPSNVSGEEAVRRLRHARVDLAEVFWGFESNLWGALATGGIAASGIQWAAKDGALLSGWTVGFVESAVRLAAKVVRGERASRIPVERAMRFGLAINLRTARTLGITVPPSLLLRADRVFE
jgi:putative ABC transport system substrate-binding protein